MQKPLAPHIFSANNISTLTYLHTRSFNESLTHVNKQCFEELIILEEYYKNGDESENILSCAANRPYKCAVKSHYLKVHGFRKSTLRY